MRLKPFAACALALSLGVATAAPPARAAPADARPAAPYGSNPAAAGRFTHDGVSLYYETYGRGEPLLLVHGNGGSIRSLSAQIAYFRAHRRVIIMDSRDQGRSSDSTGALTYEKMADDLAALIDHLKTGPVDVVGWSDGGVEALLLGARHPHKVRKLVAMAANLRPEEVAPEIRTMVKDMLASVPHDALSDPRTRREVRVSGILLTEPQIDLGLMKSVTAPTLVMSGDHDLISLHHTVDIYEALPNAQLAVLPGATHMAPYDDPGTFNAVVDRFLRTPFRKIDGVADTLASVNRARAERAGRRRKP